MTDGGGIAYRLAADVEPRRTEWLWRDRLPRGAFVLLNGKQGEGKGTLVTDLVGRFSSGSPMPDGQAVPQPVVCAVLMLEDDAERTIVPRLLAAGADMDRVYVLDGVDAVDEDGLTFRRPWRMPQDLDRLRAFIVEHGVGLVVLDPVAYMIGSVDGNAYSEVGAVLVALRTVAADTGCTIVGVRHLRKSGAADARDAGIGSVAWTAVARVEFVVGPDPEDQALRVFAQSMNNLAPIAPSLAYRIVPHELYDVGYIAWLGTSSATAHTLTAEHESADLLSDRQEARELLAVLLADERRAPAKRVIADARDAGIGERTLRKAKADLGVRSEKAGLDGGWVWWLPQGCTEDDHPSYTLTALQPCSLGPHQELPPTTPTTTPEGCNAVGVAEGVPPSVPPSLDGRTS